MKKIIFFIFLIMITLNVSSVGYCAMARIIDYPKDIMPGQTVTFKVSWHGIPLDKNLKIVVQLENLKMSPEVRIRKDIYDFRSKETIEVDLDIPKTIPLGSGYKFIVAFIPQDENWDDAFLVSTTLSNVKLYVPYEVKIIKCPQRLYCSTNFFITISWKNIPFNRGYKLVLGLESQKKGCHMHVVKKISKASATGKKTIKHRLPKTVPLSDDYRLKIIAVSKTDRTDILAEDFTERNIEVKEVLKNY